LLPVSEGWDMSKWNPLRRAALNQFGYDQAMVTTTTEGGGEVAEQIWKRVDVGLIDGTVNGLGKVAAGFGKIFSWFQTGYVRAYALMMLAGVAGFLLYTMITIKQQGFEGRGTGSRVEQEGGHFEEGEH